MYNMYSYFIFISSFFELNIRLVDYYNQLLVNKVKDLCVI